MAPKPSRPVAAAASDASLRPQAGEGGQTLNGVLLLVPILALLALAGVSLAVAAVFSIGFWPALGWTTLAAMGVLLLALAIAILRGK